MTVLTSPSWPKGAADNRDEAHCRAVRARRARLEADLIAEGTSPARAAAMATHSAAEKMLAYESDVVALMTGLFVTAGSGIK